MCMWIYCVHLFNQISAVFPILCLDVIIYLKCRHLKTVISIGFVFVIKKKNNLIINPKINENSFRDTKNSIPEHNFKIVHPAS